MGKVLIKKVTPVFRASFLQAFEPKAMEEGQVPKYGVSAVWDPKRFTAREKQLWEELNKLCDEVSMAAFKKNMSDLPANFKRAIRDGAEKEGTEPYGPGKFFASLSSRIKPGVCDKDGIPITDPEEFYSGCWARATVTCYSYDNVGKGVALGLQSLQKIQTGPRLDARGDAAQDFVGEAVEDDREFEDDPAKDPLA